MIAAAGFSCCEAFGKARVQRIGFGWLTFGFWVGFDRGAVDQLVCLSAVIGANVIIMACI